ncbi:MAG: sortase [Chloroflexota bacterium]|nr:MAG: sortase [Chloroflexota bacterium]
MANSSNATRTGRDRLASVLTATGLTILVATFAVWMFGEFERAAVERQIEDREIRARATATVAAFESVMQPVEAMLTATAHVRVDFVAPTVIPAAIAEGVATPVPEPAATPTAPAVVARQPVIREIYRILVRSIELDAPVIVSRFRKGEWEVPKFVAGHLEGTALPFQGGNVVLSGHVQSLTSGNVFARLDGVKLGDEIVLRTDGGDITYRVTGRNVVPNNDVSVTYSSGREEVTLITCTGTFNPLTNDYSHRLVVWGERGP